MRKATSHTAHLRLSMIGAVLLLIGLLTGCATTGATWRSGVPDAHFDAPPYVAGRLPLQGATIAHVPVTFQRGATMPAQFDAADGAGTAVAALLADMNEYFDGLRVGRRIEDAMRGTPPDVRFGCERTPGDDCDGVDLRRPHTLAVGRPSAGWTAWADSALARADAELLLVITLEVGNYLPRQRNLRGSKEVQLGTGHAADVRWLTAIDRPASVLQLTGALVTRDGQTMRIAAEGLVVHSTHVVLAGLGGQALITEQDVARARTERRQDIAGEPLVWQVALANLVGNLLGREVASGSIGRR
jgi:hypothetical protein